jgi:NAD(P)-dependent dehydrogenase (short-subunit alcohol dehydrogenase family)
MIVGATRGIGKVFANMKIEQGHKVALLGREERDFEGSDNSKFHAIDLTSSEKRKDVINDALKWLDGIDHLVFSQRSRGIEENELSIGLEATQCIMELCFSHFNKKFSPSVVIVSSVASQFILSDTSIYYHTNKAALESLTKWYAVNWGKHNIRVNAVAPGAIIKPESQDWYDQNPQVIAKKTKLIPLNRIAEAKEIAEIMDFLCSEKSSIINGQTIVADGGMSLIGHESISSLLN